MFARLINLLMMAVLMSACSEDPPPVSVTEFMENSRLLEATMVRCAENRSQTKYESECVNAREAVDRLATADEKRRRQELERQSERKREALRRTQEAAAAARRRAEEDDRRRQEAEYLGIFDTPRSEQEPGAGEPAGDAASANAPTAEVEPDAADSGGAAPLDLEAVRDELNRRANEQQ